MVWRALPKVAPEVGRGWNAGTNDLFSLPSPRRGGQDRKDARSSPSSWGDKGTFVLEASFQMTQDGPSPSAL